MTAVESRNTIWQYSHCNMVWWIVRWSRCVPDFGNDFGLVSISIGDRLRCLNKGPSENFLSLFLSLNISFSHYTVPRMDRNAFVLNNEDPDNVAIGRGLRNRRPATASEQYSKSLTSMPIAILILYL